jgi:hypothetical protein
MVVAVAGIGTWDYRGLLNAVTGTRHDHEHRALAPGSLDSTWFGQRRTSQSCALDATLRLLPSPLNGQPCWSGVLYGTHHEDSTKYQQHQQNARLISSGIA